MTDETLRVLLVDDDEDDYIITRDLLNEIEGRRYHLDWIETAKEAASQMKANTYDVYLVDYRLPDSTGLDLMCEVKNAGCDSPIIFLTCQGDSAIDLKAMESGAADYLIKSKIDAQSLERALRYAVQRQKMNQAISHAEKLKTAQELAGTVCHEFSQPLQILSLSLTLLKSQPEEQMHIQNCQNMVNRIGELVHKLRNITDLKSQSYLDHHIIDLNASSQPRKVMENSLNKMLGNEE
ncbi:MAG: response regulator [Calditrichia bacterium]